jgi:photosystem II stability/assembly factor-like uncharacterized protein
MLPDASVLTPTWERTPATAQNFNVITGHAPTRTLPATLYAGANPGMFKSTDQGSTWVPCGDADRSVVDRYVNQIVLDWTNPAIVYAGANNGVFKSTDGCATWTKVFGPSLNNSLYGLAIDPVNPLVLYLGRSDTNFGKVLFTSTDAGQTWSELTLPHPAVQVRALAAGKGNPSGSVLYVSYQPSDGSTDTILKSFDGGGSWEPLMLAGSQIGCDLACGPAPPQPWDGRVSTAITTSPSTPGVVYISANGLFKSFDGQTLTKIGNFLTANPVLEDPTSPTLYTRAGGVWMSTDGGFTWTAISTNLPTLTPAAAPRAGEI